MMGSFTNGDHKVSCMAGLGSLIRQHNRPPEEVTLEGGSSTIRLPHVVVPGGPPVPL